MTRGVFGICFCLIVALHSSTALRAQSPANQADLEKRVRDLEDHIRRTEAERTAAAPPVMVVVSPENHAVAAKAQQAAPPPPDEGPVVPPIESFEVMKDPGEPTLLAGWNEKHGFFLRSADDNFFLRVTGQIQADYRAFVDGQDYTDIDTFLVRRARLGIEAEVFKYYEFRLLPDFSNNQGPGVLASTRIQDAYVNVHYWDAFQVEAGKFKQPFSYEQLIQDRFVPTVERSLIDQLVPARDEGIMIHGRNLLGDRLDYALSVSNGEINGDFDTNKVKDFNARVAVRPFDAELWPLLHGLQLGMAVTTGIEQEPINPMQLRTPATVLWFQFNSPVRADGIRNRYSPEVVYFFGPLGLAAQYFHQDQRIRASFAGPSQFVPFDGFYVMTTLLLTGEERTTYSAPVAPLHPFNPCHPFACPGAWELVGRASRLDVGDNVFTAVPVAGGGTVRLADPTLWSSGATEMTLGFNWYLNRNVRMQFNWEHAWFDDLVRLGPGPRGRLNHQDSLLTRFQVIF